jgi:hypothetical protein
MYPYKLCIHNKYIQFLYNENVRTYKNNILYYLQNLAYTIVSLDLSSY